MDCYLRWQIKSCAHQDGGPEEEMEIDYVLADEVNDSCAVVLSVAFFFIVFVLFVWFPIAFPICCCMFCCCNVADGRVKPDVKVLVVFSWDVKSKVWTITRDAPVFQIFF